MYPTNNKNYMNENKDIKNLILGKIKTGEICMKPHFYFVLKIVSLIVVSILVLLTSSMLISFIIFSLIASGKLFLFGFGARGFLMFFLLFPWPLLIIEIILIILLEWLIKKFKFGYRTSLSRLVFVILLISIVIGAVINVTPLHSSLQRRAERRNLPLPFVGDFYRGIRRPSLDQEIFRGVVSDVGTSSFALTQKDATPGQKYVVRLPSNLPPNALQFVMPTIGDTVFVAGRLTPGNTIQAYGFQKFSSIDIE